MDTPDMHAFLWGEEERQAAQPVMRRALSKQSLRLSDTQVGPSIFFLKPYNL